MFCLNHGLRVSYDAPVSVRQGSIICAPKQGHQLDLVLIRWEYAVQQMAGPSRVVT